MSGIVSWTGPCSRLIIVDNVTRLRGFKKYSVVRGGGVVGGFPLRDGWERLEERTEDAVPKGTMSEVKEVHSRKDLVPILPEA